MRLSMVICIVNVSMHDVQVAHIAVSACCQPHASFKQPAPTALQITQPLPAAGPTEFQQLPQVDM